MHVLQPKHIKLKSEEVKHLLEKYNISLTQLPKIKLGDFGLPEGCISGDVVRIERKDDEKVHFYFRQIPIAAKKHSNY